ncbi:MAG: DNA repair protein RecN [Azospirillum sp.]|nr:DNA repair protein RecN [Azospirillum sp.]
MLAALSIRDVVLIERLSLNFQGGLSVLTGETGAGKSILLDALGLALGARGDSGLVRHGAEQASVIAEFDLRDAHPVHDILREQALDGDDTVVLRRTINADGRSRAFVNDQPVGVGLLRRLGAELVEVHGQFDTHGLLDPRTHRGLLDAHAGLVTLAAQAAAAWRAWHQLEQARLQAEAEIVRARAEEDYLRHALAELDALEPCEGEEAQLAETRSVLMHREKLVEAIQAAHGELAGDRGAERGLAAALRLLGRIADRAGGRLDAAVAAIDRAAAETAEAVASLQACAADIELDASALETLEERLFTLRATARKHGVAVDALVTLRTDLGRRLALIEDRGDALGALSRQAEQARAVFREIAERLSNLRRQAATGLDLAVAQELAPLKLDRARFRTVIERLGEADWGAGGIDRVAFLVATNPGAPPGPLNKIASGGELARFMLALKVVLAQSGTVPTLVFDEVDTGIGGAVAAAVGERLARLGQDVQVLVVTHSPQVAARGAHHLRVRKALAGDRVVTDVEGLDGDSRREEIARMLSGSQVTAEARAAAAALIVGGA